MGTRFIHQALHEALRLPGSGDDPDVAYRPFVDEMERRKDLLFRTAKQQRPDFHGLLDEAGLEARPWWFVFPYLLTPGYVNHEFAGFYMLYRLFSTGNTIFSVSPLLSGALYHTDFDITLRVADIPAKSFIVYWGGEAAGVRLYNGSQPLLYTFCDFVPLAGDMYEMRIVYGMLDADGDWANSGLMALTFHDGTRINSDDYYNQAERISEGSTGLKLTDTVRENNNTVFVLLFNFLLYLMATPEDREARYPHPAFSRLASVRNPKKRRKIEKQVKHENAYRYTYIGRRYDHVATEGRGGSSSDSQKLENSVFVRGHWRHQWYGPRVIRNGVAVQPGTHQQLVWIQPYWKGVDNEIVSYTTVYRVV